MAIRAPDGAKKIKNNNAKKYVRTLKKAHMVSQTIVAVSIFNPVLAIIFLPGLMLYSYLIQITTHDEDGDGTIDDDERAPVHYRIGFLIASLFFPATILCVKVTSTCAKSINSIFIKWVQLFISIYLAGRCLI